jgi:hypothetical protein
MIPPSINFFLKIANWRYWLKASLGRKGLCGELTIEVVISFSPIFPEIQSSVGGKGRGLSSS